MYHIVRIIEHFDLDIYSLNHSFTRLLYVWYIHSQYSNRKYLDANDSKSNKALVDKFFLFFLINISKLIFFRNILLIYKTMGCIKVIH